jgi:hypothetical protein
MNIIDHIIAFGAGVYEETGSVPDQIALPLVAHDKLKNACAARIAQPPHIVPGTISCILIETGHGVVKVVTSEPEPTPKRSNG